MWFRQWYIPESSQHQVKTISSDNDRLTEYILMSSQHQVQGHYKYQDMCGDRVHPYVIIATYLRGLPSLIKVYLE